jgi:hypothetical protein
MQNSDRELTLIQIGYSSALQDVYTEIMDFTQPKNLSGDCDSKTISLMEVAISQAFLQINQKFEEQTTLLFIKANNHGR